VGSETATMSLECQPCPSLHAHVPKRHETPCHYLRLVANFLRLVRTPISDREQRWEGLREEPRIEGIGKVLIPRHQNIMLEGMSTPHFGGPGLDTASGLVAGSTLPQSIAEVPSEALEPAMSESVGAGHVRKCWSRPCQKASEPAMSESVGTGHVRKRWSRPCQKASEPAMSESVGAGHVRKCWSRPCQKVLEPAMSESVGAGHVRKCWSRPCQKVLEPAMSENVGNSYVEKSRGI
jgi:hypothetical protein